MKNRGITLLELCILIAVIAISVPPLLYLFNQALRGYVIQEKMTTANFLAQLLMEQYLSMDFYDLRKGYNTPNDLGQWDFGPYTFDNPWNIPDYSYKVSLRSINPDYAGNLNDTAAELGSGHPSNFLKLKVEVWHNNFSDKKVTLLTIVTPTKY